MEGMGECDDVPVPPSEELMGRAFVHWVVEMTATKVKSAQVDGLDGDEVVRCDPRRARSRVTGVVFRPPQDSAESDASVGCAAKLPSYAICLLGKPARSIAGRDRLLPPSRSARRRFIDRGMQRMDRVGRHFPVASSPRRRPARPAGGRMRWLLHEYSGPELSYPPGLVRGQSNGQVRLLLGELILPRRCLTESPVE